MDNIERGKFELIFLSILSGMTSGLVIFLLGLFSQDNIDSFVVTTIVIFMVFIILILIFIIYVERIGDWIKRRKN